MEGKYKAGKPLFETKGNHTAFSELEKRNVQKKCQELREAGNPPGINKLSELYHEGREKTHLEIGGQPYMLSGIPSLSNSCEKSYIDESFHQRTAQVLTYARKKALLDPITTITFAILMLTSSECQQSTSIFLKLMHITAASGHKGPFVGVIAI